METKFNTQKEKLLAEKYRLQNELLILRGQEPKDLDAIFADRYYFRREAEDARVYGLNDDIQRLHKAIQQQKVENERNAKTAAYYETEEGKARKAQLQERKEAIGQQFESTKAVALEMMKTWIKDFLGAHWTVRYMSKNSITFQVWDADKADYVFGSSIEVSAERNSWLHDGRDRFETNIGAMGSFELLDCDTNTRARYYMDLGKFLTDKERLTGLKNMMFLFEDRLDALCDEARTISQEIENPLGL